MSGSLKADNSKLLYGLVAANLVVFYAVVKGAAMLAGDWTAVIRGLEGAVPAGVGLALTAILNAQLSAYMKARVVFMRWSNPLPGSEAFTHYANADPRVDRAALARAYGPLPTEPRAQNTLWYRLYKSVETQPAVAQAHQAFLFSRDYACLALMMLLVLGIAVLFQTPSTRTAILYLVLLTAQHLLAGQAARNHGRRFVATVLAIKSAEAKT